MLLQAVEGGVVAVGEVGEVGVEVAPGVGHAVAGAGDDFVFAATAHPAPGGAEDVGSAIDDLLGELDEGAGGGCVEGFGEGLGGEEGAIIGGGEVAAPQHIVDEEGAVPVEAELVGGGFDGEEVEDGAVEAFEEFEDEQDGPDEATGPAAEAGAVEFAGDAPVEVDAVAFGDGLGHAAFEEGFKEEVDEGNGDEDGEASEGGVGVDGPVEFGARVGGGIGGHFGAGQLGSRKDWISMR